MVYEALYMLARSKARSYTKCILNMSMREFGNEETTGENNETYVKHE